MLKLVSSFLIASMTIFTGIACNSQEATQNIEVKAINNTSQVELTNPTPKVTAIAKFISLNYIAKNSAVTNSPNVGYIGLLDTETGNFQSYNGDSVPSSLASTAKVIIALAVLDDLDNAKYTLTSKVSIPQYARATTGSSGPTVKDNIYRMLAYSDNESTNALIDKVGGFKAINSIIKKYKLDDSKIQCMLSPKLVNSKTCIGNNIATMRDLVFAMNNIRLKDTNNSKYMINALKNSPRTFNHSNRVFNKYGINSKTLADVGMIYTEVDGVRKEYVYAINQNFYGTNYSGSNFDKNTIAPTTTVTKKLTDKKDSISKTIQWIVNDLENGLEVFDGAR